MRFVVDVDAGGEASSDGAGMESATPTLAPIARQTTTAAATINRRSRGIHDVSGRLTREDAMARGSSKLPVRRLDSFLLELDTSMEMSVVRPLRVLLSRSIELATACLPTRLRNHANTDVANEARPTLQLDERSSSGTGVSVDGRRLAVASALVVVETIWRVHVSPSS